MKSKQNNISNKDIQDEFNKTTELFQKLLSRPTLRQRIMQVFNSIIGYLVMGTILLVILAIFLSVGRLCLWLLGL